MRTLVVAVLVSFFCNTANAGEIVKPPALKSALIPLHEKPVHVFDAGRIKSSTTSKGITTYEYLKGKLTRKTFPDGVTVDFYYDRNGKRTEARFSNGLVRTNIYDRNTGELVQIVSSDGYVLNFSGPKASKRVVLTGPNNLREDWTSRLQTMSPKHYTGVNKRNGAPGTSATWNGSSNYCGINDREFRACDQYDDYGGGGGFEGGGNWGGPIFPGDWGGGWNEWDRRADDRMSYERCMANICDPAGLKFHRFCDGERTAAERRLCHSIADRQYWECEQSCR